MSSDDQDDKKDSNAVLDANKFLEGDIFEIMGLSHLPDEEKEKLSKGITDGVEDRVFDRLYEILKAADKLDEYKKVLEKSDEDIEKFFLENNISLKQLFLEEALAMRIQLATAADLFDQGITQSKTTTTIKD